MKSLIPLLLSLYVCSGSELTCSVCPADPPGSCSAQQRCLQYTVKQLADLRAEYPGLLPTFSPTASLPRPVCYTETVTVPQVTGNTSLQWGSGCSPLGPELTCRFMNASAHMRTGGVLTNCSTCTTPLCNQHSQLPPGAARLTPLIKAGVQLPEVTAEPVDFEGSGAGPGARSGKVLQHGNITTTNTTEGLAPRIGFAEEGPFTPTRSPVSGPNLQPRSGVSGSHSAAGANTFVSAASIRGIEKATCLVIMWAVVQIKML